MFEFIYGVHLRQRMVETHVIVEHPNIVRTMEVDYLASKYGEYGEYSETNIVPYQCWFTQYVVGDQTLSALLFDTSLTFRPLMAGGQI